MGRDSEFAEKFFYRSCLTFFQFLEGLCKTLLHHHLLATCLHFICMGFDNISNESTLYTLR